MSLVYRRDQWKSDILQALEESIRERLPEGLTEHDPKRQQVLEIKKV